VSRFRNFSPKAAADLDNAVGWVLDKAAAPATAERLLSTVLHAGERLALRPQLGRRRLELPRAPLLRDLAGRQKIAPRRPNLTESNYLAHLLPRHDAASLR